MFRLVYNGKGWFRVWEWLAGVVDFRSGQTLPDSAGRIGKQRFGPYATAAAAIVPDKVHAPGA